MTAGTLLQMLQEVIFLLFFYRDKYRGRGIVRTLGEQAVIQRVFDYPHCDCGAALGVFI